MKRNIITILLMISTFMLSGCDVSNQQKEDDITSEENTENLDELYNEDGLRYTDKKYFAFDPKTGTLLDYDVRGGVDVVIPKTINGVDVEDMWGAPFANKNIESVVIPNTVELIDSNSFSNNKLTEIIIPESVEFIGSSAFMYNEIEKITILSEDVELGYDVFSNNNLEDIFIGEGIRLVDEGTIYSYFKNNLLTTDSIENYSEHITEENWNNIFGFNYGDEIIFTEDYVVNKSNNEIMRYIGSDVDIIIPEEIDGVKINKIGDFAFESKNIQNVKIHDAIEELGFGSFSYNTIKSIEIPNSIKKIEGGTFTSNKIDKLVIPKNVEYVGYLAFSANEIEHLEIINENIEIDEYAFMINNLTNENIVMNNKKRLEKEWRDIFGFILADNIVKTDEYIINETTNVILKYIGHDKEELVIPNEIDGISIDGIGPSAFSNVKIDSVVIEEGIRYIKIYAFRDCDIKNLKLPKDLRSVDVGAFGNNKITSLELPKNNTYYDEDAFKNNDLKRLVIPSSVELSRGVFYSNPHIEEVIVTGKGKDKFDKYWHNYFNVGVERSNK